MKKNIWTLILVILIVLLSGGIYITMEKPELEFRLGKKIDSQASVTVQSEVPDGITFLEDLCYEETEQNLCHLSLAYREDGTKKPLLVFVHGGSWVRGSRTTFLDYVYTFADLGYVAVTVDYDLLKFSDFESDSLVPFTGEEACVENALDWLCNHSEEYEIDTSQVILAGHSSGGQLAGHLAERISDNPENYDYTLKGLVLIAGVLDLRELVYTNATDEYFVLPLATVPFAIDGEYESDIFTEIDKVDVTSNITSALPSTLLIHGDQDHTVSYTMSEDFYDELKALGVNARMNLIRGMDHNPDIQELCNPIYDFLTAIREG